jgi:di/tricarboxylate transporter
VSVAIALGMVVVAVALLSIERIPVEVSSLAIVVLVVFTGLLTPQQALAGFSSDTAIFIFALLALTQGLGATGVMQLVGRRMLFFARIGPNAFVAMLLAAVCAFSSVASNTAVTAAFLPVAIASAKQAKVPPGKLLMPMAFSSMLGGTITLFGSSTNLVASAAMESLGLERIGFIELAQLGLPLAIVGITATLLFARRLLPATPAGDNAEPLAPRAYLTEAVLAPGSRLIGKELSYLTEVLGVPVCGVLRSSDMLIPDPKEVLWAEDHLIISGSLDDILRVLDLRSIGLRADLRYAPAEPQGLTMVEVSVPPTSGLIGKSVRSIRFADRFGVLVLGIHRHPTLQRGSGEMDLMGTVRGGRPVRDIPLFAGDVLLVSGSERRVRELAKDEEVLVLGAIEYERPRYRRAALALAIFALTVFVAGTRLMSPAIAGLTGMLAMIATGCVNSRTAFRVNWRVVIMIGALLTLGQAMENSGAGEFLAEGILPLANVVGPHGVLVAVMVATIVLSIPMSNQAAALVMLPVGVHLAIEMGLNPRTFAIGICLAASCSFLTPLEPSAALVYGPGRYRVADFLRVGGPLTALMLVALVLLVPVFWPFALP